MKKILLSLSGMLLSLALWAGNGMGPVAVALIQNEATTYTNYRLSSDNWPGNAISSEINDRPLFHGLELGECTSLFIDGAAVVAWAEGNDYYTTETFRLHYRVYAADGTAGAWSAEMPIDFLAYRDGNNYRYHVTGKEIDVLALVNNTPGQYKLDVQYLAKKFWSDGTNGGSWNSDGNVCTATFTIPQTGAPEPKADRSFYFDFGPVGRENATAVSNPDANGNYWNNIGADVTASPWRVSSTADYALLTSDNTPSLLHMGFAGDLFLGNGAGGWTNPSTEKLGDLAVVNATRDYLFASNSERCGLVIRGLDKNKAYQFKIFASRSATDNRYSLFEVEGLTNTSGQVQAAGRDLGGSGVNQNVSSVFLSDYVFPDAKGEIKIFVKKGTSGQYLPINCMRMQEFANMTPPVVVKYDQLYLKGTGVEDESIAMHMLAAEGENESQHFETFCRLTKGGTIACLDKEGFALYESTVSVETGIYRVKFHTDATAPELTPITYIGMGGNVISAGWSNTGEEMVYQGHGIWTATSTMVDYTGTDSKRLCWYVNKSWNPTIKALKNHETLVAITDDADCGVESQDVYASPGRKVVTLDLRHFTYSFDCAEEGEQNPLITFFGSSVCNGQGATDMHGYAYQYMQGKEGYRYLNNSINGNNTTQLLNRFYGNLVTACSDYVVIGLGLGNEGIHDAAQPEEVYLRWKTNMLTLIEQAEDAGMQVVATNNYPRGDYNATDYAYVKRMNLEMQEWNIPTVNFLGALDNCQGNGQWAEGYQVDGDIYHPNDAGHALFMKAIVPSLFDALANGKTTPERSTGEGLSLAANESIEFTAEGLVGSYAYAMRLKTTTTGRFLQTRLNGTLENQNLPTEASDGQWHTLVVSHYQAAGRTYMYLDGQLIAQTEQDYKTLSQWVLGGIDMQVSDLMFWRSALNPDEVKALEEGVLLRSSLEIYCPLNDGVTENIAQSTNTITCHRSSTSLTNQSTEAGQGMVYDVLGRMVDAEHPGVIIRDGQKVWNTIQK